MSKINKKILVVDDSSRMQEITRKLLTDSGYKVVSCWDGDECLQKVQTEQPDMILMDVILPDGDGKEFTKKLREMDGFKDIPVIFTTNTINLDDDKGHESFEIDGELYRAFAKPLHNQKILSVIKKEINRKINGGVLPKGVLDNEKKNSDC